jgi:Skp family chaperone for outer membrane proteins
MKQTILLGFGLFLFSNQALASNDLLVVDTRKVIETSAAHQDLLAKVQKKNEEFRDLVQQSEAKLKKKYQDLETKKNALSQEALDKKNEEMSKEVAELQKTSYSQHTALEEAYRNATESLIAETKQIVAKQAKEKGYKLVIEKAVVIYSENNLDITEAVLAELNKNKPTVEVTFKSEEKAAPAKVNKKSDK